MLPIKKEEICISSFYMERITGLEIREATFEPFVYPSKIGADYGARTRHLDLGKVALYQMS